MADDGAADFYRLSKALKAAGRSETRKALNTAMRQAARPLVADAKGAAKSDLPQRGGLAARLSKKAGFRAQVRTGESTAGVRITSRGNAVAARTLNATGEFRHPVFADPAKTRREWTWVRQSVPSAIGWFDRAMEKQAPQVKDEVEKAIESVAEQIVKEAKR